MYLLSLTEYSKNGIRRDIARMGSAGYCNDLTFSTICKTFTARLLMLCRVGYPEPEQ